MIFTHNIKNLSETKELAEKLSYKLKGNTIFLKGGLGAGKTTFVNYAAESLGANGGTSSPTFSIANTYPAKELPVIHIDLYRIESEDELEMTGFWEIIQEKATIFIEWADKFDLTAYIKKCIKIEIVRNGTERQFIVDLPNGNDNGQPSLP